MTSACLLDLIACPPGAKIKKALFKKNAKMTVDKIKKLHSQYGSSLKLSLADIHWAYGMVESRTYKSVMKRGTHGTKAEEEEPAMIPYLDICNHSSYGQDVGWGRPSANEQLSACLVQNKEQPLKEDIQEIFTNYFPNPGLAGDANHSFLLYGFV